MTTQTKVESFLETMANVVIGFIITFLSQLVIFPAFGIKIPPSTNFLMGLIFTVISIVRTYTIRRWFNGRLKKMVHNIAQRVEHD